MTDYVGEENSKVYLTMTSPKEPACGSWKGYGPGEGSDHGAVEMIRVGIEDASAQGLRSILEWSSASLNP